MIDQKDVTSAFFIGKQWIAMVVNEKEVQNVGIHYCNQKRVFRGFKSKLQHEQPGISVLLVFHVRLTSAEPPETMQTAGKKALKM